MGLLTADPYENAWIILGLVVAALVGVLVVVGGPAALYMTSGSSELDFSSILCTGLLMLSALIPLGMFSSGLFVDFINQNYQYSTASIVGFMAVLATKLFGSTAFADISKAIVGFIPSIKTPTGEWSYLGFGSWFVIFGIIAASVGASFGAGGTSWGEGITIGVIVPLILVFLAGNGLLGNFSQASGPVYGPERAPVTGGAGFRIDPYPSGYCDVPGFTWASNMIAPTSIILTQTIVWFNMIKDWDTGNSRHSILVGSVSTAVFALQWLALKMNGCLTPYKSGLFAPLVGYIISIAFAGTAYGVIKNMPASMSLSGGGASGTIKPSVTPTGMKCPAGYNLSPSGDCIPNLGPGGTQFEIPIAVGGERKTSEPVDDQDAFVCEAYKDGELVTSTIVD
jgi:hypothetical protein